MREPILSCFQGNNVRYGLSKMISCKHGLMMCRLSVHGDHMVKFADEAGSKSSFGVQMSTPFRCEVFPSL